MAETTQFVSRISVKDLISAFESKSDTVRIEFSRPRARSYGNVLSKNVIVRLNEFITLEDIEKGLTKLETNLNFYEVYNKEKHVAFQEQFFNILTSIANIENDDEDAPVRKKRLISRTQTLVSFLNQKLPSNINQVIESKPKTYTPYSSYIKSNPKAQSNSSNSEEPKQTNGSDTQPDLYVETNGTLDVPDSGRSYFVSVKKLKQNFQQKNDEQTQSPITQEKVLKINQKVSGPSNAENPSPEQSTQTVKQSKKQTTKEQDTPKEEKVEAVSVTKLRGLFELRSEENSKGLEIITVDKSQVTKNILGTSIPNISIPFTERNLGTFRLQRSVSGNYMNYSGLLKRVDINRSISVFDTKKENNPTFSEGISDENSDAESEDTLENRDEPVVIENINENDSHGDLGSPEQQFSKIHVGSIIRSYEVQIKSSSRDEQEENNNNLAYNASNGTATLIAENQNEQIILNSENVSHQKASEEVNHPNADTDVNTRTEEELGSTDDETEVMSGISVSKTVQLLEETIEKLEATKEDTPRVTYASEATKDESNTEHELVFKGVDEIEVNSGTAESQEIRGEEDIATLEVAAEASESASITESNDHISEDVGGDETGNSAFSSLLELEDERERSLMEEEMKKIDVEQTLANADLVINPEDLKNADDEFERLIENAESGKIIG